MEFFRKAGINLYRSNMGILRIWKNRFFESRIRIMVLLPLIWGLSLSGWALGAKLEDGSFSRVTTSPIQSPLSFEANVGQVDGSVKFFSRRSGFGVFFTPQEALLVLQPAAPAPYAVSHSVRSEPTPASLSETTLGLRFVGPDARAVAPVGRDKLPGQSHYFLGRDPRRWHSHVPQYSQVVYSDLYPGIDLIFYGRDGQLEYDLVVDPGTDPQAIQLQIQGAQRLSVTPEGGLELHTPGGVVLQHPPVIYQERDGIKTFIAGHYEVSEQNRVSFAIQSYDTSRPLYIDPILSYGTYIVSDGVESLARDAEGNWYLTGGALPAFVGGREGQRDTKGYRDAFVTKLDPSGRTVLYTTYMGGSLDDQGRDLAVDEAGYAYVVGITSSSDLPIARPIQSENAGSYDLFFAKVNPNGDDLEYTTYLGGSGEDGLLYGLALALDKDGNAYLSGSTNSANFPTHQAFKPSYGGGVDAFVVKIEGVSPKLLYSTYLGGTSSDYGGDVAVDRLGQVYVVGTTFSRDFPTLNPFQAKLNGTKDLFVTKINSEGSGLVYSTYLGGSAQEEGWGMTLGQDERVFVTGSTQSSDYPVVNPVQPNLGGLSDILISQLDATGQSLLSSTYFGGQDLDKGIAIDIDSSSQVYVTGATSSPNFPVTWNAPQRYLGIAGSDAFVLKLNGAGTAPLYATFLGGNGRDIGKAIVVEDTEAVFVAGKTASSDFPLTAPREASPSGGFVAKLGEISSPPEVPQNANVTPINQTASSGADLVLTMEDDPDPVKRGGVLTYTLTVANLGPETATGVGLTDVLPSLFRIQSVSASQGSCNPDPVLCQLGTLGPGAKATVTILGTPLAAPVRMINEASTFSDLPDPDVSNNSMQTTNFVEAYQGKSSAGFSDPPDPNDSNNRSPSAKVVAVPQAETMADLRIVKNDSSEPAVIGEELAYLITVSNLGPDTATEIVVRDILPEDITFGSVTPASRCEIDGQEEEVMCEFDELVRGQRATIRIEVIPTEITTLVNTAQVTSATTDENSDNNIDVESTRIVVSIDDARETDLSVFIRDVEDPINPNLATKRALVTWRAEVANIGPELASGVRLTSLIDVEKIDGIPPTTISDIGAIRDSNGNPVQCTKCSAQGCPGFLQNLLGGNLADQLVLTCNIADAITEEGELVLAESFGIEIPVHLTQGVHTNTAIVTTTTADTDSSNNESTDATTVAVPAGDPPRGGEGDGSSGCFIATAAFGSPLAREIQILRDFRDQFLLPSQMGNFLVRSYYSTSPPIAGFIAQYPTLRTVTRLALYPVVWWADFTLQSPYWGLIVFVGAVIIGSFLFYWTIRARYYFLHLAVWRRLP